MNITSIETDKVGILASTLCLLHCVATPFLFLATSCAASCCETSPYWWKSIDFIFLIISYFAIYKSTKHTTKTWIKYAMWASWTFLFVIILNENISLFSFSKHIIYIPSILLVIFHLLNLKYSTCKTNGCHLNEPMNRD